MSNNAGWTRAATMLSWLSLSCDLVERSEAEIHSLEARSDYSPCHDEIAEIGGESSRRRKRNFWCGRVIIVLPLVSYRSEAGATAATAATTTITAL